MTLPVLPDFVRVDEQVRRLHLGVDAAELHGGLCGMLAGGGEPPTRGDWLARVLADDELQIEPESVLDDLYVNTVQLLDSSDFGFELLLPDDDAPVNVRGDALLSWCRGFLGGFGLAAGNEPPLSEDSQDALRDLSKMAGADLSYDDPESDDDALEEVCEYVRVAAMLLHSDCVLAARHRRRLN